MGQYAEHSGHVTDQREPVSHRVLRRLPQMISDRDFKPGAPLPARRTLAGEPDVGRSLLGEALPVMRMFGLVSREPGLRARVLGQSVAGDKVSRRWRYGSRHSERRVFEVRLRLEAGAARLVAERVNPESLAGLTTCLAAMKAIIRAADRIGIHLQA